MKGRDSFRSLTALVSGNDSHFHSENININLRLLCIVAERFKAIFSSNSEVLVVLLDSLLSCYLLDLLNNSYYLIRQKLIVLYGFCAEPMCI